MRVGLICADPGIPVFGSKGCSIHVQEVARGLGRRGAQIELFCTRPGGQPPADLADLPLHTIAIDSAEGLARRELSCLAANASMRKQLQCRGPFELIYERYSLWSFSAMEYARETATPGLLEVNAPLIDEQAGHRGLHDRRGAERVARRVFSQASALLAVSEPVMEYLEGYAEARGKVHLIPNGVDPRRFHPNRGAPGRFTIAFVGSLKPWHGLPLLIDVFSALREEIPEARLIIVGDGPERDSLQGQVHRLQLSDTVTFTGALPPSEIPPILAAADVGVAPYPRLSSFYFSPLKVLEYMAAGLPVVTSRLGQLRTLINDNVNGLLCPAGDRGALFAALARLARRPALRRRLGEAARDSVLHNHSWDHRVSDIVAAARLTDHRLRKVSA